MKRVLSLVLALVLVLGMIPTFAAEDGMTAGQHLFEHEFIAGDENGNLMEDQLLTREQLAKLVLELNGSKDEADALTLPPSFTDAAKISAWARPYVAYAQIEGLFKGYTDGTFRPQTGVTGQVLAQVLTRALGYEFAWETVVADAADLGIEVATGTALTRGQAFEAMWTTVNTNPKGEEITLGQKLGKIEAPVENSVLAVSEVKAASAKSFDVMFNKAVTDEDVVTYKVTRGTSALTVDVKYNEEKTVASLARTSALAVGKYTVEVLFDGKVVETKEIEIETQKLAKIEITSSILAVGQDQKGRATFVAYDQYGVDVTNTYLSSASAIQFITGVGTTTHKDGIITIDPTGANINLMALPSVTITAIANNSTVSTSKSLTPSMTVGTLSSFEMLPATDLVVRAGDTSTVIYIPFKALDMSGNETKNYEVIKDGLFLNASDELTVSNTWVSAKLVQDPANSKNAAIRVTAKNDVPQNVNSDLQFNITAMTKTGKVSTIAGTLQPVLKVSKIVLLSPTEVVASGERVVIPFEAFDQNGNQLTKFNQLNGTFINYTGLTPVPKIDGSMYLISDVLTVPAGAQSTTVMVSASVIGTGQFSNLSVLVQKAAQMSEDLAVEQESLALESGGERLFGFGYTTNAWDTYGGVSLKDQYGRTIDMVLKGSDVAYANYRVRVISEDVTVVQVVNVTNAAGGILTNGNSGLKVVAQTLPAGVNAKTTNVRFELYDATAPATVIATRFYPITVVASDAITGFEVTPVKATINVGGSTGFDVVGKTASGSKVELADYSISANPVNVVDFESTGDGIKAKATTTGYQAVASETVVKINVFHNGRVANVETSVKSTLTQPVSTSIGFRISHDQALFAQRSLADDTLQMNVQDFNRLTKVADLAPTRSFFANGAGVVKYTISALNGTDYTVTNAGVMASATRTAVAGASFIITGETNNGLTKTIKVVAVGTLNPILPVVAAPTPVTYVIESYQSAFDNLRIMDAEGVVTSYALTGKTIELNGSALTPAVTIAELEAWLTSGAVIVNVPVEILGTTIDVLSANALTFVNNARAVQTQIEALPAVAAVVVGDQAAVTAARVAYDALTPAQQALVTNLAKLTDAEDALLVIAAVTALTNASLTMTSDVADPVVVNAPAAAAGISYFITAASDTTVVTTGEGPAATSVSIARNTGGSTDLTLTVVRNNASRTQIFEVTVPAGAAAATIVKN